MQLSIKRSFCRITLVANSTTIVVNYRTLSLKEEITLQDYNVQKIKDFALSCQDAALARKPHANISKCTTEFVRLLDIVKYQQPKPISKKQLYNIEVEAQIVTH